MARYADLLLALEEGFVWPLAKAFLALRAKKELFINQSFAKCNASLYNI